MKSEQMLIITNMLARVISELDDVKGMLKKSTYEDFAGEEE
tara:strand:+ start:272 stop:394 length:123 start_codon:yes stop_codon:yes gene_type:complete